MFGYDVLIFFIIILSYCYVSSCISIVWISYSSNGWLVTAYPRLTLKGPTLFDSVWFDQEFLIVNQRATTHWLRIQLISFIHFLMDFNIARTMRPLAVLMAWINLEEFCSLMLIWDDPPKVELWFTWQWHPGIGEIPFGNLSCSTFATN